MTPDRALLYAARGLRRSLGEFPAAPIMDVALGMLRAVAAEYADIAQLEAKTGEADESITAEEMIERAAGRRMADLLQNRMTSSICQHGDQCEPGCPHVAMLLLLPDQRIFQFARAWKAGRSNAIAIVRDAQRIVELGRANNLLFDDEGLPPPERPDDD